VLQDKVCSEAQIEFFSTRYGTSARSVYTKASHPLNYETSLLEKTAGITYKGVAKLFGEDLAGAVSQQLVSISPGATHDTFESMFPTRYIYKKFHPVTTSKTHSVKEGCQMAAGFGCRNGWNASTGPSIPEKYLPTVESSPEH
jgi:hypothetical protein